jgi:hypothetical protein
MLRCQNKTDGTTGEVIERTPCIGFDQQTLPRMVQQDGFPLMTIIQRDMETTTQSDDKLL